MGRQPCCDKKAVKQGPWTTEEDQKLINFVLGNGKFCCWRMVPKLAGLQRCGKSCRLRWVNYLRPDVKRGLLSDAEEQLVIGLHARLGNRWSQIASRMPGRTDNELKNHWHTHIKKKLIKMGIDPVTHEPLNILSHEPPQDEQEPISQTTNNILSPVPLQCENEINCQMTEKILSPEPLQDEQDQTNCQTTDKILSKEPLHNEESNFQTKEMISSPPLQSPLEAEKQVTPVQNKDNDMTRTQDSTCYSDQSNLLSAICAQIDESVACYLYENGTPAFLNSPREFPDTRLDCQDFGIQDFEWDESCSSLMACPDFEIQELGFDC